MVGIVKRAKRAAVCQAGRIHRIDATPRLIVDEQLRLRRRDTHLVGDGQQLGHGERLPRQRRKGDAYTYKWRSNGADD